MSAQIEIILKKSWAGTTPNQKANLTGLGLMRREQRVVRADNPSTRGMIQKVIHLVEVGRPQKVVKEEVLPYVQITPPKEPVETKAKEPKTPKAKMVAKSPTTKKTVAKKPAGKKPAAKKEKAK
jgi:large subunit ribosomal protein L30